MRMGTAEAKFADIIWENEPISSGDLAKLGNKEFEWKKTTSFTVLKRLCERDFFRIRMERLRRWFQGKNFMPDTVISTWKRHLAVRCRRF